MKRANEGFQAFLITQWTMIVFLVGLVCKKKA